MTRSQKIRLPKNHRGRKPTRTDQVLRAVAVHKDFVQQRRALDQSGFERAPFFRCDDKRNGIKLPRTFHPARIAIDIVSDALFVNESLTSFVAAQQLRWAELIQRCEQAGVVRTDFVFRAKKFIERFGSALVTGQKTGARQCCLFGSAGLAGRGLSLRLEHLRRVTAAFFICRVRHCANPA